MDPRAQLEQLFISKVRIKALRYFMQNPSKPIHLRGAVRELGEEINAVRRELTRMEKVGLLNSERKGNRKYFSLNGDFPFYDELVGMVYKTFDLGGDIISQSKKLGDIKYALLTQSYTHGVPSGKHKLDLVVVGDNINTSVLTKIVEKAEKKIKRDIYYSVLSVVDLESRKKRNDMFMQEVIGQKYIMLIGNSVEFLSGT